MSWLTLKRLDIVLTGHLLQLGVEGVGAGVGVGVGVGVGAASEHDKLK